MLVLANKESLIVGGPLVKALAKPGPDHAGRLRALRALPGAGRRHPRRGPQADRHRLRRPVPRPHQGASWPASPRARRSPTPPGTWARSSPINSATLVNKGLEVIEAHLLYDIPFDRIEVVVHPQSYIHSMVEFTDGSTLAQASPPDMRMPIALGLGWPRAGAGRRARLRLVEGVHVGVLPARRRGVPVRARWPAMWVASAAPRPRCSTRPTRSASTPSSPAGCRSPGSWTPSPRVVEEHGTPRTGTR